MTAESAPSTSAEIRRLLKATDLVELVSRYSALNPTNTNSVLRGYCPLSPDDSQLFFVLQASQTFHCLGCGAVGDALSFMKRIERVDQSAAIQNLQRFLETSARDEGARGADPVLAQTLIEVHDHAARFYTEQLRANTTALEYLHQREVTEESITHWTLGYAPDAWDATLLALKQYPTETLVAAGLAVAREGGGHYDRFRGRLMFPIRDLDASIIGLGGRVLGGDEPKYLNSPESPLFHKRSELYGQYESSQVCESVDRVWVVEGYMDVVSLWQRGIRNCVATLGTSTTTEHVLRLSKLTDTVLYCFDGDRAGRSAALRALQNSLPALNTARRIQFLLLPEGEDPDSLVRKAGADAFEALASQAVPLSDFLCRHLAKTFDVDTVDGRARLLAKAATLVSQVPDVASRYEIAVAVADLAQVTPEVVEGLSGPAPPSTNVASKPVRTLCAHSARIRRPAA